MLKSEFEIKDGSNTKFRRKTHLIEVINDKSYMINSINQMNSVIGIMIDIIDSNSPSDNFKKLFNCSNGGAQIDFDEMEIFHNFMRKILKDEKILPKALLMKYILSVLITNNNNIDKGAFKRIYGTYLLSVLFIIFESKKNIDVFFNVLKASNDSWYDEALKVINSYFEASKITDNKIIAQFKKCLNEDEEDYRFRCKSLATIYNFFTIKNDEVYISDIKKLKKFISDDELFTTEHFVISESKHKQLIFSSFDEEKLTYKMEEKIYKQYVNNLFNFIFISREMNDKLENYWLPHKLKLINIKDIECEYSKMVIKKIEKMSNHMESYVKKENYENDLDSFFYKDFKEKYIVYSRDVLNAVIEKIKNQ